MQPPCSRSACMNKEGIVAKPQSLWRKWLTEGNAVAYGPSMDDLV